LQRGDETLFSNYKKSLMPLSADEYHAWFIANDTKNSRQVWKIICLATIPLPYSKVRAVEFTCRKFYKIPIDKLHNWSNLFNTHTCKENLKK